MIFKNGIVMSTLRTVPCIALAVLLAGCAMVEGQYYLNSVV